MSNFGNYVERITYLLTIRVDGQLQQCEIQASSAMMYNLYSALPKELKVTAPHCGLRFLDGKQFHDVEYAR